MNDLLGAHLDKVFYEKTHNCKHQTDEERLYFSRYYNIRNTLMHNLGKTYYDSVSHNVNVILSENRNRIDVLALDMSDIKLCLMLFLNNSKATFNKEF